MNKHACNCSSPSLKAVRNLFCIACGIILASLNKAWGITLADAAYYNGAILYFVLLVALREVRIYGRKRRNDAILQRWNAKVCNSRACDLMLLWLVYAMVANLKVQVMVGVFFLMLAGTSFLFAPIDMQSQD